MYKPLQSAIDPSTMAQQKTIRPSTARCPCGMAKILRSGSGAGRSSGNALQPQHNGTESSTLNARKCHSGITSKKAAALPSKEPLKMPTQYQACSSDMMGRPDCFSTAMPSVLMATSKQQEAAPTTVLSN